MSTARFSAGATLLQNGQVLVAGGLNETLSGIATAELYDPSKGTWNTTGNMNRSRATPATLLPNGQVLMAGGNGNTAELYNPSTAKWTLTATMYFGHTLTRLLNGQVLASGGGSLNGYTTSAELYTP
jgi:uncharacterized membrane protein